MDGVATGRYQLVYAAPERLRQPTFFTPCRGPGSTGWS
jgi:hypothetical protein